MTDDRDVLELLDGYLDGSLSAEDARRLLARLEQSDALREQLAWLAVVQRLLLAAHVEPVKPDGVLHALRERGLMPAPRPPEAAPQRRPRAPPPRRDAAERLREAPLQPGLTRRRSSDQPGMGLAVFLSVALGLLVAGGAWWWHSARPESAPPPVATAAAVHPDPIEATGTVSPQPPPTRPTLPETNHPATPPIPEPAEALPTPPAWPLSAFEDGAPPAPPGDGSQETGFVPPPEPAAHKALNTPIAGTPSSRPAATVPRNLPQTPLLWVKLREDPPRHGDATPQDLDSLLAEIKARLNLAYRMESKTLDEVDPQPEKNPVLYATGHYRFAYTPAQRANLRKFMLAGGLLVFDAGLGSKPFYDSARRELGIIFRDAPLQRLGPDHPLFRSYYDIARVRYGAGVRAQGYAGDEPWFEGVIVNCRTVAIVSRWGLAMGWEKRAQDHQPAYAPDDALKLGINLFSYALAVRNDSRQNVDPAVRVDREPSGDKLFLGQVVYDGEWKTKPSALLVLLRTFNQRTAVPVKFGIRELRLSDPKIFDAPLLYLTGHERFIFTSDEARQLRKYLLSGGLLWAEACCGRKGFDQAFRAEMKKVFPDGPLAPIPLNHDLFTAPNAIHRISVTPSLASLLGTTVIAPKLEGLTINGAYAVIYSSYGMAGSWEMYQSPYALGYNDVEALRLGQNILMYALTH
ncbi:MAG: DUF4159 domain-containing protein [Kiritimatiellaeota bacterium]|nr:DUF4159 domain-containing protein [Kiritimatiellota bacterium]